MSTLTRIVMTVLLASTISLFNLTVSADPGKSQGQGQGQGKGHGQGKAHQQKAGHADKSVHGKSHKATVKNASSDKNAIKFSSKDQTTIRHYFDAHPLSATSLPPGIAKNLARGKPLPPGIAKRYLPNDLLTTLPSYPGSEYFLVGRDAVLVNPTTGIVTDIIANVLK